MRAGTNVSRYCATALVLFALSACGGGGGGGGGAPSDQFSLSPGSLTFSAASPSAPQPASQTLTVTVTGVSGGTLFIRIVVSGAAVSSVTDVTVTGTTTGTATVNPAAPGALGPGTHTATITVSACTTDPNCSGAQLSGSPRTVNVTYTVGPVTAADGVAPYIGTTNVAGDVIIRGRGFTPATSVHFGTAPATAFTVVSDSEIRATYPQLSPNTYPVILQGPAGTVPFTKSLTIVDAPAYGSTSLTYPPPAPQNIRGLVYDAERKALLVGVGFSDPASNRILRYEFSGVGWQAPTAAPFQDLRDIALSLDGSVLLAISDNTMTHVDPVTLALGPSVAKPVPPGSSSEYLKGLAIANDGKVVVTTGLSNGTGSSRLYFYEPDTSAFSVPSVAGGFNSFFYAVAGASGDGSNVTFMQTGLSPETPVYRYTASTGVIADTGFGLQNAAGSSFRENIFPPAFDRVGSRMTVATIDHGNAVFDANFAKLGTLPLSTASYAVSPDASRVYTLDVNGGSCAVRAFDADNTPGGSTTLTEITVGFPIALAPCPGGLSQVVRMLVTPAGDSLFIAGPASIAVVSLP